MYLKLPILKRKSYVLLSIIILIIGCNIERRTYNRAGGNHLHLKSNQKELFWFNGIHGNYPKNPMFKDIAEALIKFNPDFVLTEGNATPPKDSLKAILKGENVYVTYLAEQHNILWQTSEPNDSCIFEYLQESFKKDEIFAMYFIRQMVQWKREDISAFDSTAVAFSRSVSPILYETKDLLTIHQISNKIQPYTGISLLTNHNWKDFDAKQYLYFSDNRIHAVYNATSTYRNQYLLQLIEQQLKLHDCIFIMIGFDHAKEVERELISLFKTEF